MAVVESPARKKAGGFAFGVLSSSDGNALADEAAREADRRDDNRILMTLDKHEEGKKDKKKRGVKQMTEKTLASRFI
jgi:hypothetical protein